MATKAKAKLSVRDVDYGGKRVFMRVDFNVPIRDGKVADDTRIQAAIPTIKLLRDSGAKLILASHLGRPKGEKKPEFSLAPAAARLGEILGEKVEFVDDCIGPKVENAVAGLQPGQVLVLETLYEEGLSMIKTAYELSENQTAILTALGWGFAVSGNKEKAHNILHDLKRRVKKEYIPPFYFAKIQNGLGNKEEALNCLDKAYREHDISLAPIKTDETFSDLRSEPRFIALLEKMSLKAQ